MLLEIHLHSYISENNFVGNQLWDLSRGTYVEMKELWVDSVCVTLKFVFFPL